MVFLYIMVYGVYLFIVLGGIDCFENDLVPLNQLLVSPQGCFPLIIVN